MPHRRRVPHDRRCPSHVTLRAASDVPSLRDDLPFSAVRAALAAASNPRFRVLQWSVQHDHLHLLAEADEPTGFERGVRGLAIRVAKALNRILGRRGRVWADRYHARSLRTPREVRNALVYVLSNWRKHIPGARGFDPRSTAAWFRGWSSSVAQPDGTAPIAKPRTWLAAVGLRLRGLIDVDERPRAASR
jgi:REP-associated tyrosine transposase